MGFVYIFIVVCSVVSCLMALWNIRQKKRIVQSVLTFPLIVAGLSFTFAAPPIIWYFHSELEDVVANVPAVAEIVIADKCNLFSAEKPSGAIKQIAFAGSFFLNPGISAMASFSANEKKSVEMSFGNLKMITSFATDESGEKSPDFSVYADHEKVAATQSLLYGYKDEDAVLIMEKIADAKHARIVLTQDGKIAETELSAGDICRFRKLRDLWRSES